MSFKYERLIELEKLLLDSPQGLRRSDVVRKLGLHRGTAARYLDELSGYEPVVVLGRSSSFPVIREQCSPSKDLSLYERARFGNDIASSKNLRCLTQG